MVNQSMGEALTAVMGITPGRAGRHMAYSRRGNDVVVKAVNPRGVGPATEATFEKWPIGQPGTSSTGVCVAFPTKESLLRDAGETRGLSVVLSQAIARRQCLFARPNSLKKPKVTDGEDVIP